MRKGLRISLVVIGAMASAACPADRQPQWAADLDAPSRNALMEWLMCEDCPPDARNRAAAVGSLALAPLDEILVNVPDSWRTGMMARYGRLARRIGEDSARVTDHYLSRFDASVQRRSVLLLGTIGGTQASAILRRARDSAAARRYSSEVIRTIESTLVGLELTPFTGQLSDSSADFLDTVIVRRGTGPAWNGNESVRLIGAPFPDDVVVWQRGDSLGFVAAGEPGWYVLNLAGVGAGERAERDSIHIRSFPASPQVGPSDVPLDSLPRTVLLALARTPALRDTARFYRFRSTSDRAVNASVEWAGPSVVNLVWQECAEGSFPGPARRVSGTVVDEQGNPIAGAQVSLEGTLLGATAGSLGRFVISTVPIGWTGTMRARHLSYQTTLRPASEGRSEYWVVLKAPGSSQTPVPPVIRTNPSPNAAMFNLPARRCRLLGVVKTDSIAPAVVARIRVAQP